jgi:hypothetical protein
MASINTLKKFSFFVLLTVLFLACTRISTSELGLGLLPAMDAVNTKDTILDVVTETVDYPDSLRIYGSNEHIVGNISNDPIFGTTHANMFFQLKPDAFPFYFPGIKDSLVVDSAVLILSYRGFYGDSSNPVTINVNNIDEESVANQKYYASNYPNAYNLKIGTPLANPYTLDFTKARDSIISRFEQSTNQIRIKLLPSVANMLIKGFDTTGAYRSDSAMRTYFNGFSVTTNMNSNVLIRIGMTDTNTKLGLYFKSYAIGGTKRDTSVLYFKYSLANNADANFITRNRTTSEAYKALNNKLNDSLVYVQTSPGTMVKVVVPGLKVFKNKLIHRAELIAEQVPDDARLNTIEKQMLPPKYLFLGMYDTATKRVRNVPNDYIGTSSAEVMRRFGGWLSYKSIKGYDQVATYNFNVSRYVQGVISRTDSIFDFRILAPVNDSIMFVPPYPNNKASGVDYLTNSLGNEPAMGRVRLGGGKHSKFRMRLHIYYSDL